MDAFVRARAAVGGGVLCHLVGCQQGGDVYPTEGGSEVGKFGGAGKLLADDPPPHINLMGSPRLELRPTWGRPGYQNKDTAKKMQQIQFFDAKFELGSRSR